MAAEVLISYLQNVEADKDFQFKIRETRSLTNILPWQQVGAGVVGSGRGNSGPQQPLMKRSLAQIDVKIYLIV